MLEAELIFRFPTVLQYDKKGNPFDASETITERVSVTGATELANWAETRRFELGAVLVNTGYVGENA